MTSPTHPSRRPTVSDVSAWVLRGGVVCSSLVMLVGILFTFAHGTMSIQRMKSDGFDYRPAIILEGIRHGQGKRIIEAGIYLLVFTPILRVFASCVLFAFQDRDRLYAMITFVVLLLTLAGLLWIG
ncbi:MAG: DUF1634 domain-containing protein [Tepidisphaeraceae bacterium]